MSMITIVNPASISLRNLFNQSSFHFMKKISQLLFNPNMFFTNGTFIQAKNYSHGSSFYLRKQLFSSFQLLLHQKLSFINPASIYVKNYFRQSNFHLKIQMVSSVPLPVRETIFFLNPASISI